MTKTKTFSRLGAGVLAVATVAAGLSFGPAANAATATPSDEFQLIFKNQANEYVVFDGSRGGNSAKVVPTIDAARAAATKLSYDPISKKIKIVGGTQCVGFDGGPSNPQLTWGDWMCSRPGALVEPASNGFFTAPGYEGMLPNSVRRVVGGGSSDLDIFMGTTNQYEVVEGYQVFGAEVESTNLHARSAVLKGVAVPGSTVIINDTIPVETDPATGEWTKEISGLRLGKNTVKLEQYEGEGEDNRTAEATVEVDLNIAAITAEAVFPKVVSQDMIISGTAQAGADVEIWHEGKMVKTVKAADITGRFTADIVAPNAGGEQTYTIKQTLDGETAADTVDVKANFGAAVSITTPVNDAIHDGGALKFQGHGVSGGTVQLREQGKQGVIGSAEVLANGVWTIDAANIPGKKATYVATQTGKGNNVTTSSVTLNPDGDSVPPVVNPIAAGSNELVGTGGTEGATIIVRDKDGNEVGRGTVGADGSWKVIVNPDLGPGQHDLEVIERHDGQDSDPTPITVDFGAAVVATDATADDKGVVTYTGTGAPNARIEVKGKSGRTLATGAVGLDGKWTAVSTVALPAQRYTVDVFQSTGIGVKSSAEISFDVNASKPVAKDVAFTGPARNSTVTTSHPTFSGTGEPGAKVIVRGSVRVVGETTVTPQGTWSVRSSVALGNDSYALVAVQTPTNGAAQSSDTNPFRIASREADSLVVTSPAANGTVAGPRPVFSGTGDAGATITIKGSVRTVATVVVQNDKTWSVPSEVDLAKDTYNLTVTQSDLTGEQQSTTVAFTVR